MTGSFYAPRFEIRVSGLTLAADVTNQVTSVTYDNNLDMADMFKVTLSNADNQLSDSPIFDLGKSVEIHMGYGAELTPMMYGEITAIHPNYPSDGAPTITITGYDRSYKLRHNQPDRPAYQYMNDSAIAALIAAEAGLIPIVDPSPYFHEHIQQTDSDMAFLAQRARANFFETFVHWDRLYFRFPRPQTEAIVLEWGKNLQSFAPRVGNAGMNGIQVIRSYNEEFAQTIVGFATAMDLNPENIVEKLGSSALDALVSLGKKVIRDQNVSSPVDALALAKALLQEILEGMYEASGSTIGLPELTAGKFITVQGVGKRFSGRYRLKKVTHTINGSGYRTSFEVTQRSTSTMLQLLRKTVDVAPPDKQQKFDHVVVAKVVRNVDEKRLGRVKVTFPWFSDTTESAWARVATMMAGASTGTYFLPDVGDEVLVGFIQGDFSKPVVLGSLWNGINRPPENNDDGANRVRRIRTRIGSTIVLDDTPAQGYILVQHPTGGEIRVKADGTIQINAKTNLDLNATGNINLTATNVNVSVTGTMDVS